MRRPVGWSANQLRRSTIRYVVAVVFGLMLGLSVAVPVFAADRELHPRVVGGEPVPTGDYPFVASLGNVRYGTTAYGRHFCGASLIDSDSVLTAAHCAQGTPKRLLRVTVGRTVLSGSGGQTRRVSRIDIHPRFTGRASNGYDAAVLTLNNPVGAYRRSGSPAPPRTRWSSPVVWPRWLAGATPSSSPQGATTGPTTLTGCARRACR